MLKNINKTKQTKTKQTTPPQKKKKKKRANKDNLIFLYFSSLGFDVMQVLWCNMTAWDVIGRNAYDVTRRAPYWPARSWRWWSHCPRGPDSASRGCGHLEWTRGMCMYADKRLSVRCVSPSFISVCPSLSLTPVKRIRFRREADTATKWNFVCMCGPILLIFLKLCFNVFQTKI